MVDVVKKTEVVDGVEMVTQLLSNLPGHLTTAGVILYIMVVFLPARDNRLAEEYARQESYWVETVKQQRQEFLQSSQKASEMASQDLREARNLCYGTIAENQRLLQEILKSMKGT